MDISRLLGLGISKTCLGLSAACGLLLFGCSDDEEQQPSGGGDTSFELTSEDVDCSGDGTYLVPFAGKTYTVTVTATDNVEWNAVATGNLVSVTPEGTQTGNGTIQIVGAANPEKEEGRTGTVVISNLTGGTKLTLTFRQMEKELYIPEGSEGQTREEFDNPASTYNVHYMVEGENVALFWDKNLGLDPSFDQERAVEEADKTFVFLQNEVGFASKSDSYANKYKFLIFIRAEDQSTAYGGGDHNVGKIWLGPNHLETCEQNDRYGIYYHEMCHCFQFLCAWDGAGGLSGPIGEMTSQFAMIRKWPNWMELEPSHINAFMRLTHLAFLHEANQYHSPYVLEYWENVRGPKFVSRLWQESATADNKDIVAAYKRITGVDQETFNDELFDAYRRFITWDIPSIKEASAPYANKHSCKLTKTSANTYRITSDFCPQNYGYNGIKLTVPAPGTKITLNFIGMPTTTGYWVGNGDEAGWRFGFVAMKIDGERVYSDMGKATSSASMEFDVPEDTQYLWLVVMGAPTKHHKHEVGSYLNTEYPSDSSQEGRIYSQWPYQVTLLGTEVDPSFIVG